MIKKIIQNKYQLESEFKDYKRENHFTRYDLLFDYLDNLGSYDLDIIALCCELFEFSNIQEYNKDYNTNYKTIDQLSRDHFTLFDSEKNSFIVVNH
jgi:hypothetical protein